MNDIIKKLKKYFKETPREKVLSDWSEAKKNAPKGGPKIKEFLSSDGIICEPLEKSKNSL